MMRYVTAFFFFIFVFSQCNLLASTKSNIIKNLNNTENLSFKFKQHIGDKTQEGNCLIEYPKKFIVNMKKVKILVSNGKKLVIQNLKNNQYYIYPIEKTA